MNLGPAEILVILVVALIVFGPKRLPEVGRQVGAAMRELRKMQHAVHAEIDHVMNVDEKPDQNTPVPAPADTVRELEDVDHTARPELSIPEEPDDGFDAPRSFS